MLLSLAWIGLWFVLLIGWGRLLSRVFGSKDSLPLPVLFWLGWIALGVDTFTFFWLQWPIVASVWPFIGLAGLVGMKRTLPKFQKPSFALMLPLVMTAVFAGLHFVRTLFPPVEADSLAYHFALPRLFAEAGELVFSPIAVDYAVPLLTQSTWLSAYHIGSEPVMLALAWLTSMMAVWMIGTLAVTHLPRIGSMWVAVVMLSLPLVSYGFVAGTVEVRMMGVAALAVWALYQWQKKEEGEHALLWIAAFAVGALVAMKIFGLFLAFLLGLFFLWSNRLQPLGTQVKYLLLFKIGAACVLVPFYGWLWWESGSPLFPLGCGTWVDCVGWSAAQQSVFESFVAQTRAGWGQGLLDWLLYPFEATLHGGLYDNSRTGVGPLLPFVAILSAAALWVWRPRGWKGSASLPWVCAMIFVGYFALWFFLGASTKVRHLLPVLPLGFVAAVSFVHLLKNQRNAWAWRGFILCGVLVLGMHLLAALALSYAPLKALWHGQSGEIYQTQQVPPLQALTMVDALPQEGVRVFHTNLRQLNYNFPRPYGYGYPYYQATIPFMTESSQAVWTALKREGYSHWLAQTRKVFDRPDEMTRRTLVQAGCLQAVDSVAADVFASRTLRQGGRRVAYTLYALAPHCTLSN